jgi:hypothetical protein
MAIGLKATHYYYVTQLGANNQNELNCAFVCKLRKRSHILCELIDVKLILNVSQKKNVWEKVY